MLTLQLEDFMVEFKDGGLKHVGPKTQGATVKAYHIEDLEARAFGDDQVKLAFDDGEGSEVEIALQEDGAKKLLADLEELRRETDIID